jgi:hypothetical protein
MKVDGGNEYLEARVVHRRLAVKTDCKRAPDRFKRGFRVCGRHGARPFEVTA